MHTSDVATDSRSATSPAERVSGATRESPVGTGPFYLVAFVATLVSINTSWRYFGERLHVPTAYGERYAMFAVVELTLVACGWAMRSNVRRPGGKAGKAAWLAWAICGASGYMAVDLSGPIEGIARVALGPVLALVALHLALGIEIRVKHGGATGVWAKVRSELRERALSRFGLGDDARKAAERTRDRALDRAARLATRPRVIRRDQRLARAVFASGAPRDPKIRHHLVERAATLQHIGDLYRTSWPSPWSAPESLGSGAETSSAPILETPTAPVRPPLVMRFSNGSEHPFGRVSSTRLNGSGGTLGDTPWHDYRNPGDTVRGTPGGTPASGTATPLTEPRRDTPDGTLSPSRGTPVKGVATEPRATPLTSDGTPEPNPADADLLKVLRNPSRVPREPDGTVPIKRAMAVLGVGRNRAIRCLETLGLRRFPDPSDDGSDTPERRGSDSGSGDDQERLRDTPAEPLQPINGTPLVSAN